MKRMLIVLLVTCGLAAACSRSGTATPATTVVHARLVSALQSSNSCDALLAWIKSQATAHVGPYGFNDGRVYATDERGVAEPKAAGSGVDAPAASAETTVPASTDSSAGAATGTNNQESAVDEMDRVKTDGTRLVAVNGDQLIVADIASGKLDEVGRVTLPVGDARIFLRGDHVYAAGTALTTQPAPIEGSTALSQRVTLIDVDVSGPPRIVSQVSVDGSLVDGRMNDGGIRLVISTSEPVGLGFVSPNGNGSARLAIDTNRKVIADSKLADWLPSRLGADGRSTPLLDCSAVYHPAEWSGPSMLSVLTITGGLGDLHPTAVVTDGQTAYASPQGLYVATQAVDVSEWNDDGSPKSIAHPTAERTAIHRFDISTDGPATYQGSGTVDGTVRDPYSLSERNGDIRVVSTTTPDFGRVPMPLECPANASCGASTESSTAMTNDAVRSILTVLRLDGPALEPVGRLDGLGTNESVQAVRFVDDRAYVVTYRQTDPLFVIDLSEPSKPTLLGELHQPGFSSYLHPIGDGRLLGVGSASTGDGETDGVKVELYDTSDPLHPTSLASVPVDQGYSAVASDTHAFTWDAEHHLAIVPMSRYVQGRSESGAAIYRVAGDTLSEIGWIDHSAHESAGSCGGNFYPGDKGVATGSAPGAVPDFATAPCPGAPGIDRTLVSGGRILALSALGISAASLDDGHETAWLAR